MSLRYFVLGLLAQRPMSGYGIKRFLKSLSWLIGSPSAGSLYPILGALLREGLVTVETVPGLDRPPRKIYTITEAGSQALQGWLEQPIASNAPLKAFVMRLLLAGDLSHSRLVAHLQQRRAQVADHRTSLEQTGGTLGEGADLGQRLALDYGLTLAAAELTWLDDTMDQLARQLTTEEVE